MPFSIGGFKVGVGPCGCCAPPCNYSLTVGVKRTCDGNTAYTARFQGPLGEDFTRSSFDTYNQWVVNEPSAGTWTITVKATDCGNDTRVLTATIVQCKSLTLTADFAPSPYPSLSYSDDYGSCTLAPRMSGGVFLGSWTGTYSYTSSAAAGPVTCHPTPYTTIDKTLKDQTGTVNVWVGVECRWRYTDAPGVRAMRVYRGCEFSKGLPDCYSLEPFKRQPFLGGMAPPPSFNSDQVIAEAFVSDTCGEPYSYSGTLAPMGTYPPSENWDLSEQSPSFTVTG